jgi:hypothetical protein
MLELGQTGGQVQECCSWFGPIIMPPRCHKWCRSCPLRGEFHVFDPPKKNQLYVPNNLAVMLVSVGRSMRFKQRQIMLACHDVIDLSVHNFLSSTLVLTPSTWDKYILHKLGMSIIPNLQRLLYANIALRRGQSQYTSAVAIAITRRQLHMSHAMMSPTKRKAEKAISPPNTKKSKVVVPEYHLAPCRVNDSGEIVWPARFEQIERARDIIKEW